MLVFFKDPDWISLVSGFIPLMDSGDSRQILGGPHCYYKSWKSIKGLKGPESYKLFSSIYNEDLEELEELVKVYGLGVVRTSAEFRGMKYPSVILESRE